MLKQTPFEFEVSVAKIFEALGYRTKVTPSSNDGGKDIIMYKSGKKYLVECKKYNRNNLVGRPELQKFFAAIVQEKAIKGYFITTSDFTTAALNYPVDVDDKVELFNGERLMELFHTAFPNQSTTFQYEMVCKECGDKVPFVHPGKSEGFCSKGHQVISDIEDIIKIRSDEINKVKSRVVHCPKCSARMRKVWSRDNRQYFWGCTNYPTCRATMPLKRRK
jgi:restriction system protein